jgi:hypothetical protein
MKQTRLLEIIREEIAGALNEAGLGDQITALDKQIEAATKQIAPLQKRLADLQGKKADLQKKEADLSTKTQAQLEEETLNERPFIDSAFDVTGTSPENLNQDSLQKTIDDAVKVLQQEYPDADVKKLAGELQKVNSAKNLGPNSKLSPEVKSALQKVADVIEKQGQIFGSPSKIDDLMKLAKDPSQIDRLEKLKSKGYTFILGNPQAVTAIEKSLGLKPKNNDSLLADKSKTEKPKAEKSPKAKAEKAPKAKAATRTKGDDGFDNVSYSDVDDEGNKIEIDTTIQTPTGDADIESKLNSVISAKKSKLKAAKKGSPEFEKELAALTSFLQGSEISKYIKKKTVGGSNPYSISNILKDIE